MGKFSLAFILCEIFTIGFSQFAYPPMGGTQPPMPAYPSMGAPGAMPLTFGAPSVFPMMPFAYQPSCYTVCYPPPVAIMPGTCSPPPEPTAPPTCEDPSPSPTTPTPDTLPTIITPEEPIMVLRKKNFTVNFELGNYPLDVYYLMDYSGSFQDDKMNLVKLTPKLIDTIAALSSDYQLGFGSFVDKPVSPFGNKGPPADYSFWNQIPLSKTTDTFSTTVQDTPILNGMDIPEGIFDGLYQAAACASEIGWRPNARKIILVTTDAPGHKAGEGNDKAGLAPFDGKCHLGADGKYTEDAVLDYPSEDQIKTVMEDYQISVIFAVTADSTDEYSQLIAEMKSAKLATLTADSSNVIDVLKEAYNEISSSVEIEAVGATDDMSVNYYSTCSGNEVQTSICPLPPSGSISYTVEVEVNCPVDPSKTLSVNPIGVPANVDIDMASICV